MPTSPRKPSAPSALAAHLRLHILRNPDTDERLEFRVVAPSTVEVTHAFGPARRNPSTTTHDVEYARRLWQHNRALGLEPYEPLLADSVKFTHEGRDYVGYFGWPEDGLAQFQYVTYASTYNGRTYVTHLPRPGMVPHLRVAAERAFWGDAHAAVREQIR